jgi:putative effector of murein hydrolase LrgA (UPF0299 family)
MNTRHSIDTVRDYALAFLIGCIIGSATIHTPIPGPIMALAFFALLCRWLIARYDAREGGE